MNSALTPELLEAFEGLLRCLNPGQEFSCSQAQASDLITAAKANAALVDTLKSWVRVWEGESKRHEHAAGAWSHDPPRFNESQMHATTAGIYRDCSSQIRAAIALAEAAQ